MMVARTRTLLLALLLAPACAANPKTPAIVVDAAASQIPCEWMVGDWRGERGTEHWFRSGDRLYGIALGDGFEVMIVEPDPAGAIALTAMPGGADPVVFGASEVSDSAVRFINPGHDDPQSIDYARSGDTLTATVEGPGHAPLVLAMRRMPAVAAPELEAADRGFQAAIAARGADGWAETFDPRGAMMHAQRIEGRAAIAAAMRDMLAGGTLTWAPTVSRVAGELGLILGRFNFAPPNGAGQRGSYVTIWRRQSDGSWMVLFDVGRPDAGQAALAAAG